MGALLMTSSGPVEPGSEGAGGVPVDLQRGVGRRGSSAGTVTGNPRQCPLMPLNGDHSGGGMRRHTNVLGTVPAQRERLTGFYHTRPRVTPKGCLSPWNSIEQFGNLKKGNVWFIHPPDLSIPTYPPVHPRIHPSPNPSTPTSVYTLSFTTYLPIDFLLPSIHPSIRLLGTYSAPGPVRYGDPGMNQKLADNALPSRRAHWH